MAESNVMSLIDAATSAGVPYASDAINDLLTRGGDWGNAVGGEGAASFQVEASLDKWVSSIGAGRNNVVILGDSNAQHEPANTYRWAQALKTDLLAITGLADGGPGFRHLGLAEWAKTGTWVQLNTTGLNPVLDIGPNGQAYYGIDTPQVFTWTLPSGFTHDRFVLYGVDDDFINIQAGYSLNGGAYNDTAWSFATNTGVRFVKQEVVGTITTTLRVRPTNFLFQTYFAGAAFYQGTAGLIVHNLAAGGSKSADIAGAASTQRLAILDDLQPKLTILWVGSNDFHHAPTQSITQVKLLDWYNNLVKITQKAKLYGDCLIVYPMASQDPNVFSERPYPWPQAVFEKVARHVAWENQCAFVSIHQLWGDWVRANARGRMSDSWHLNQTGHTAVGKFLAGVLTRNS